MKLMLTMPTTTDCSRFFSLSLYFEYSSPFKNARMNFSTDQHKHGFFWLWPFFFSKRSAHCVCNEHEHSEYIHKINAVRWLFCLRYENAVIFFPFQVENRKTEITNGLDRNDAIIQEKWIFSIFTVTGMGKCLLLLPFIHRIWCPF